MVKLTIIAFSLMGQNSTDSWLRSIKSQRYRFWEAILIESRGDAGRISTWHGGGRKPHVKEVKPPSSRNDALNMGLAMASGDVICLLPINFAFKTAEVFGRVADIMEDPEVDLICGDIEVNKSNGKTGLKTPRATPDKQRRTNEMLPQSGCLFVRADWWHYFGGLETCYRRSAEFARMMDLISQPGIEIRYASEVRVTQIQEESNRDPYLLLKTLEEIRVASSKGLLWSYVKSIGAIKAKPFEKLVVRSEFSRPNQATLRQTLGVRP